LPIYLLSSKNKLVHFLNLAARASSRNGTSSKENRKYFLNVFFSFNLTFLRFNSSLNPAATTTYNGRNFVPQSYIIGSALYSCTLHLFMKTMMKGVISRGKNCPPTYNDESHRLTNNIFSRRDYINNTNTQIIVAFTFTFFSVE
jgi:hypothetical protein